jgi:TrkA-N domain.
LLSLVSTGVFNGALTSGIIIAALGSSLISSIYSAYSDRLYRLIESTSEHSDKTEIDIQDHTIIVGSGLIGRKVAESFDETVVLENDKSKLGTAPEGSKTLLGDARDDRAWSRGNVSDANKIISTVRSDSVAEKIATLDVEADKYALTGSKRDSSMLDLDIGVTQEELTEHKIREKLGRGFDEGFEGLKKDLIKQLKDLT